MGGNVREEVRAQLTGYIARNSSEKISFEEWNGDKLAAYIQSEFLREDLMPEEARSLLRKSLSMIDEPDVSYRHFAKLVRKISSVQEQGDRQRITAIRQLGICLWILFGWSRDAKNTEAAYRAAEITLLYAWGIVKFYIDKNTNRSRAINSAFFSIFSAYTQICEDFLATNVLPYVDKRHALSHAIFSRHNLDVNLKLFDLLGRIAMAGLWSHWFLTLETEVEPQIAAALQEKVLKNIEALKALISNNPALLLPAKDDQAIDIMIATLLLAYEVSNKGYVADWLGQIAERSRFSYKMNERYPAVFSDYGELLGHPQSEEIDYRERATSASILYPSISLWAALLGEMSIYEKIAKIKTDLMPHCTFQFWYPDETSEEHFYRNSDAHGAVLPNPVVEKSPRELLEQAFGECDSASHTRSLSAVRCGWWPLIVIACRHHRMPLPLDFFQAIYLSTLPKNKNGESGSTN